MISKEERAEIYMRTVAGHARDLRPFVDSILSASDMAYENLSENDELREHALEIKQDAEELKTKFLALSNSSSNFHERLKRYLRSQPKED